MTVFNILGAVSPYKFEIQYRHYSSGFLYYLTTYVKNNKIDSNKLGKWVGTPY